MMLIMLRNRFGPLPSRGIVSFQNTGKEHEATLVFVDAVSKYLSMPVIWLEYYQVEKGKPEWRAVTFETANRTGQPMLDAIKFENDFIPGPMRRFCTKKMKFETLYRFLRDLGWDRWTNIVGFRSDEIERRGKRTVFGRVTKRYPLAEWGIDKETVALFWDKMPFRLEIPTAAGRNFLGNCQGCFLKSELDLALLARHDPEEFKWWEAIEEQHGKQFTNRFSYKELRLQVEAGADKFKVDGFFCQKDLGECTGDE